MTKRAGLLHAAKQTETRRQLRGSQCRRGQIFGARPVHSSRERLGPFFSFHSPRYLLRASIQRSRRRAATKTSSLASIRRRRELPLLSQPENQIKTYTHERERAAAAALARLAGGGFHWGKPKVHYPLERAGEINTRVLRCVCARLLYYGLREGMMQAESAITWLFSAALHLAINTGAHHRPGALRTCRPTALFSATEVTALAGNGPLAE